ncbi:unnamed protein product, partial [marine sediment metagenome]
MLGYKSTEELVGRLASELSLSSEWRGLALKEALVTGYVENIEIPLKKKDGTPVHILATANIHLDDKGNVEGTEALFKDITERKRMEQETKIKDSAIASSINAIAISDLQGTLTYVNPSFLKLWGYDRKEVLGKPASKFWQTEEKAEEIIEALRDRGGWRGELVANKKDGSLPDVQISASMVTDEIGKPICMMASFLDITERKQMERALQEKNTQLDVQNEELQSQAEELMTQQQELIEKTRAVEKANRLKSEFLANMS